MSKEEQILEALGGVKNSFILESSQYVGNPEVGTLQKPQEKSGWKHIASAAAMLVILFTGLWVGFFRLKGPETTQTDNTVDTSLSCQVKISAERTMKLVLETPVTEDDYRRINRLLIYDEQDNLIQTIYPEETENDGIFLNEGLFVNLGSTIGEPDIRDVNFDGFADFGLLACSSYPQNVPYNYFLWNEAREQFEFGFTIFGASALEIDSEEQYLINYDYTTDPATQYRYRYENGKLVQYTGQEQSGSADPMDNITVFYDDSDYTMTYENDAAYIRSRYAASDSLQVCELEIRFVEGLLPYAACQLARQALEASGSYTEITEVLDDRGTVGLNATGGQSWDSPCADVRFYGVGAAGTYQLTARYFLEAAEGHGAAFRKMMNGVICDAQSPNADAEKVITNFADAYFAGDWESMRGYLADTQARKDVYPGNGDLVRCVSLKGLDALAESDSASVSLTFLESPEEDSYTYLTMDVSKQDGEYKIRFYGLEK